MAFGVSTIMHFGILSLDRDIPDSIHEIGGYTSREDIPRERISRREDHLAIDILEIN